MFSRPEISGWNPAPSSSSAASLPVTDTSPEVGCTIPARSFKSVDLPEPLAPMTPTISPRATSKERSTIAGTASAADRARRLALETKADLSEPTCRRP